jgi:manganese/zinc/iron transport system permease protein
MAIFSDITLRSVLLGSILLGSVAGLVGSFAYLQKRALLGDALAHAALPGVVIGFLVAGGKTPIVLLLGAAITAWLGARAIDWIGARTRLKHDTSIAIVLSVFFAAGVVGLSIVQKHGAAAQSGLSTFLFGHAASLLPSDVLTFAVFGLLAVVTLGLLYKELKAITFDRRFAFVTGLPVKRLEIVMTSLIVAATVIGLQAVGVVMMSALLITPAAAARLWSHRLSMMLAIAAGIGMISGFAGTMISYSAPRMPTGPWIVLVATALFIVSFVIAPQRGVLSRLLAFNKLRARTHEENLLKTFYHLGEQSDLTTAYSQAELARTRTLQGGAFARALRQLQRKGWVEQSPQGYHLTKEGRAESARVVRLHRLWEVYLTEYLHLPADHVHPGAEQMEHVLTPELERELEALLERPRVDPHGTPIPYESGDKS